jgi:hypothetical protein
MTIACDHESPEARKENEHSWATPSDNRRTAYQWRSVRCDLHIRRAPDPPLHERGRLTLVRRCILVRRGRALRRVRPPGRRKHLLGSGRSGAGCDLRRNGVGRPVLLEMVGGGGVGAAPPLGSRAALPRARKIVRSRNVYDRVLQFRTARCSLHHHHLRSRATQGPHTSSRSRSA